MASGLITSPCPRGGRRAPKERDGRGATSDRTDARVVLRSEGGRTCVFGLRLDEWRRCCVGRCTSPGDTAFHAAYADLSSDKERLGKAAGEVSSGTRRGQDEKE